MPPNAASLPSSVHDAWDRHVEQCLSTPEGPSVATLLAQAAEGEEQRSLRSLFPAVAARCETPAVQKAWADWTAVTDREEIRLRLEAMSRFEALDPALHPCVLFFFRASDPPLYQLAARVLGTHLDANADLRSYLDRFAANRDVDPKAPISLTGKRSRRRLLIALAAHRAAGGTAPVLDTTAPTTYLTLSPPDLNAVLAATRMIVEDASASISKEWEHFGVDLLEGLADVPMVDTADPSLFRSWGLLFTTVAERHPDRTTKAWSKLLRRLCAPLGDPPSFPAHLQRLSRLDEIIHGATLLSPAAQQRLLRALPESLDERQSLFLRYRWVVWTDRERTTPPDSLSVSPPAVPPSTLLDNLVRAEAPPSHVSGFEDGPPSSRRLTTFVHLLSTLGDKSTWFRRSVEHRALAAFSLLDFSRHLPLPATAVDATLDHFAFPPLQTTEEPARILPGGRAGPATYRILLRLTDWEDTSAGQLVGTNLLHQITDLQVLLMLLPSREASEWTAVLADATEHQLRLHSRTRPDFQPEQFLYETSVRAPHPQFYENLYQLCQTRTYQDAQERTVPVSSIVERLRDEARAASSPSTARLPSMDAWPGNSEFARNLRHVRRALKAVLAVPDPIEALETAANVFDPKSKDPNTGSRGIISLLGTGRSPSAPLVARTRETAALSVQALRDQLQAAVLQLYETIPHLQPRTFEEAHGMRDDALHVEEALDAIEQHVVPVLGVVEAHLLDSVLHHLKTQLQAWTDALATLHTQWQAVLEDGIDPFEEAALLFDHVRDREPGPLRTRLLDLLAHTLVSPCNNGTTSSAERWTREHRLLEWALDPDQLDQLTDEEKEQWTDVFASHWNQLATTAMKAGHEGRVRCLTTNDRLSTLYERSSSSDTLEAARTWFLDRYHAAAARQITTLLRADSWTKGVASTVFSSFVHFSRVWLALLLGAILMLDFGDAWTAMAEERAVGSVAVTFVVGVLGTLGYLVVDLQSKVERAPEESFWQTRRSQWRRAVGFLMVCLLVTVAITSTLWALLSGTGAVVEGPGAVLHVVVWTGFALFVGVFFGLIAETA